MGLCIVVFCKSSAARITPDVDSAVTRLHRSLGPGLPALLNKLAPLSQSSGFADVPRPQDRYVSHVVANLELESMVDDCDHLETEPEMRNRYEIASAEVDL